MEKLDAALAYAKRGWAVIPLRGKLPAISKADGGRGVHDATTDCDTIREWWTKDPDANVGIACGQASSIWVLDIDGDDGEETLAELVADHGPLPATVEQLTGNGRHILFTFNGEAVGNSVKFKPGLDTRSDGGYIVAAPSFHQASGRTYTWEVDHHPDDIEPEAAPDWLLGLVAKKPPKADGPAIDPYLAFGRSTPKPASYGKAALDAEAKAVASAPIGSQENALNTSALILGRLIGTGTLDYDQVRERLITAGLTMVSDPQRKPWTEKEVAAKVEHGLRDGMAKPVQAKMPSHGAPQPKATPVNLFGGSNWPAPLADDAIFGLAGQFVRTVEPHSEADIAALLGQFLLAFGNAAGASPHFLAEADRHGVNLNAVFVGETAKGRKGTSWGHVLRVIKAADPDWGARITSGLSSGEGLIWQVRDPITRRDPIKEKGRVVEYQEVIADEGIKDKRLLTFEGEFASVLRVSTRDGNTLTSVIRNAWDTGDLSTLVKNNAAKATGAHVSILGHITRTELLRYLEDTEAASGFGNRFLWFCVQRSKILPEGGNLSEADRAPIIYEVSEALSFARDMGELRRDAEAREIWFKVYGELSEGKPGLLGAMIARAEAQVMRLACIYALLDKSPVIRKEHLLAALAVWDYADASARFIFGERMGDPVGDKIMAALAQAPQGMTRSDISDLFGRHRPARDIERALHNLRSAGHIRHVQEATGGRSAEKWTIGAGT